MGNGKDPRICSMWFSCILHFSLLSILVLWGFHAIGGEAVGSWPLAEEVRKARSLKAAPAERNHEAMTDREYTELVERAVQTSPDEGSTAAEMRFYLGEAHLRLGNMPEATAYLRMAVGGAPDAPWAADALGLLRNVETPESFLSRCRDLVRQHPDTPVARMAWIFLAEDALQVGKAEEVSSGISQIEAAHPDIVHTVPGFLDLKARLAVQMKDEEEARDHWLRQANIETSPSRQASAFFEVAESCRRAGRPLDARKYYAFLRRKYSGEPQALFSAFRLAQLEAGETRALSGLSGAVPVHSSGEEVFRDLMERHPDHPLAEEACHELMGLQLKEGRISDLFRTAGRFATKWPQSRFNEETVRMIRSAGEALGDGKTGASSRDGVVAFGKAFFASKVTGPVADSMAHVVRGAWLSIIKTEAASGEHLMAVREARALSSTFPDSPEAAEAGSSAVSALLALDATLLKEGKALELLNTHFAYGPGDPAFGVPGHLFHLGNAWKAIGCEKEALRSYFAAWQRDMDPALKPALLAAWARTALDSADVKSAESVLHLYDSIPNRQEDAEIPYLRLRLAMAMDDMEGMKRLLGEILSEGEPAEDREKKRLLFDAALMAGDWSKADSLWQQLVPGFSESERDVTLGLWGDRAFRKGAFDKAVQVWESMPDGSLDDSRWFRLALARKRSGLPETRGQDLASRGASKPGSLVTDAAGAIREADRLLETLSEGGR